MPPSTSNNQRSTRKQRPDKTPEKKLSSELKKCRKWIAKQDYSDELRMLIEEYVRAPIVLFTGAGVSVGPRKRVKGKRLGLPTWYALLDKLAGPKANIRWNDDPWKAADQAMRRCGGKKKFKIKLKAAVTYGDNYTDRNGCIVSPFISNAPTLNSTAAFCGAVTARIVSPEKNAAKVHFRSAANPRVHSVLTSNYDCFLESAASSLFRKSPLKPVTALGSSASSSTRIPVFHIHGYVPHPKYQIDERPNTVDELVITRKDYEKHWDAEDVFGTTMGPQIHFFRYFTVLFVGFSFTDEYVCRLLERINSTYLQHSGRKHFALLPKKDVEAKGDGFFSNLGVVPIAYDDHDEIPAILGDIYKAGLAADRVFAGEDPEEDVELPAVKVRTHAPRKERYRYSKDALWQIALRCRYESVGKTFLEQHGEVRLR